MAYGLSNGHVTDDVTWPWKVKLVTPICLERNILNTTWARDFKFGRRLCMEMPSRRTNNFPESGRGLGHVTPTIFGSTVGYPSDSLASCFLFKSAMELMTWVDWNEWLMSQSSLITPTIILITGHFSNSVEMLKFHGEGQIPRLGSKFRSPQKTVGPNYHWMTVDC